MLFSEKVKFVRSKMNLSQTEFAKLFNVSFNTINRWERGHTEPQPLVKKVFYDFCEKNGYRFDDER